MKSRFFFALVFILTATALSAQCAMCRAVAQTGSSNGQNVAGGLNNAILYLMAAPYIILFFFFRKKIWGFLKELRGLWG